MFPKEPSQDFSTPRSPEHSASKRPASERKIQANRRNALRSTGPTTARGKRNVSRNAIKHGLLAREVVITAGDGAESLREFHDLAERLWEQHEPVGVVEESLVQTIATCWWRKARILRAENGEIRKRLDTMRVDRALRDSDKVNLYLTVSNMELRFLGRENSADRIPLIEQWAALQRVQTTLRSHHSGLAYLQALLERAKKEITCEGYISGETAGRIFCDFGFLNHLFALVCCHASAPAAEGEEDQLAGAADDKEAKKRSTTALAAIEHQLETIGIFKNYASEREEITRDAEARSFSLPPADATDKLLRYEAHLDRQLYRAMDQLERLQRQRRGETVLPPININMGRVR